MYIILHQINYHSSASNNNYFLRKLNHETECVLLLVISAKTDKTKLSL